ncbi:MAG: DUF177 domain-containing protein [Gammaproteobacteria bacterium]|nr:DUF177 domain-containing protein [Gammaproteobacteria bacterium]
MAGPYDARAMGNPLRDRRDPQNLAANAQVIEINEQLGDFDGLAEIVAADLDALDEALRPQQWRERDVTGELRFGYGTAQAGLPLLSGTVEVCIDAVCQRCLKSMRFPLRAELELALAAPQADIGEAGDLEVWELDSELIRPIEIVQEALIMALPLVAMHSKDGHCDNGEPEFDERNETTRPFADLRQRMANKK